MWEITLAPAYSWWKFQWIKHSCTPGSSLCPHVWWSEKPESLLENLVLGEWWVKKYLIRPSVLYNLLSRLHVWIYYNHCDSQSHDSLPLHVVLSPSHHCKAKLLMSVCLSLIQHDLLQSAAFHVSKSLSLLKASCLAVFSFSVMEFLKKWLIFSYWQLFDSNLYNSHG